MLTMIMAFMILKGPNPVVAKVNLNGYTMEKSNLLAGDIEDFVTLSQRFAQEHTYNLTNYNCQNYTNDLYKLSKELGFKTEKVVGCTEDENKSCHAWLKLVIDFEPQSGTFKDYSKEYPDQTVQGDTN